MSDQIDQIDEHLRAWVTEQVDVPAVSFGPPGEESSAQGVNLFLLELEESPPSRPQERERAPLEISLRYLVTTWAEAPKTAHRLLGALVFGAREAGELTLEFATPEVELWESFGISPRPSFFLSVPLRGERSRRESKRVRRPLVLESAQVRRVGGRIVGPDEVPVPNATVTLPGLDARTETDRKGRFRFEAVPRQSEPERLVVQAKGTSMETQVDLSSDDGQPLTIQLELDG